jgi:hypothetical protein
MKRMNSAELARRVTRQRPDIEVLLMRRRSRSVEREGAEPAPTVEKSDSAVVEDPFTPEELRNT